MQEKDQVGECSRPRLVVTLDSVPAYSASFGVFIEGKSGTRFRIGRSLYVLLDVARLIEDLSNEDLPVDYEEDVLAVMDDIRAGDFEYTKYNAWVRRKEQEKCRKNDQSQPGPTAR